MLAPDRSIDDFTLRNLRQKCAECPSVSAGQVEMIFLKVHAELMSRLRSKVTHC